MTGRPKHLWSIYEKMVLKGREFDDIFDLVGIRVIVDSVKDCYAALGCIHGRWKPVHGPVQGLHRDAQVQPLPVAAHHGHRTGGKPLEVQIRTREMHQRAEWGVAAHWAYKDEARRRRHRLAEPHHRLAARDLRPGQFMENLKTDLEQDEVFVFTPKGRVITLPGRVDPDRLRLRHPHRGRPRLHRRPGQRPAGAARPRCARATRARSSPPRSRGRPVAGLAEDRQSRLGPATRSASGSPASGGRTPSRPAATS